MINPLECVKQIELYMPGKPVREPERALGISGCIKLASNENPAGPSPKAVAAINKFLAESSELCRYPDGSSYYLKQAPSEKISDRGLDLDSGNFILGNGSNELLDIAARTYVGPGDEAVMATPSFAVYSMAVRATGGVAREVGLAEYRHNLSAMADAISLKTKIVFIGNPNNPTGTI